jgi:hypothetical protein
VEGNVYYAPDRSFSVATPHPSSGSGRETYEWTYAKVKEGEDEGLRFVEFGPFAWDLSRYSVDVFPPPPGAILDRAAENYFRHIMEGEVERYESLGHAVTTLNGRRALYYAFRHRRNAYVVVATFIDFGARYAAVVAMAYPQTVGAPSEDDIRRRAWDRYNRFAESLTVPATASGASMKRTRADADSFWR